MTSEPIRSILLTGAGGFLGRRLVARLAALGSATVRTLLRTTKPDHHDGVTSVVGDIASGAGIDAAVGGCDTIVHAAALTGKARPRDFERTNVAGTRRLIDAAKASGVRRILFLSSVAARFEHTKDYPYARSKAAAEDIVKQSGLDFTIVRPTIIIGKGAAVLDGLAKLATLPIVPCFGNGRARLQPIFVDQLAEFLTAIIRAGRFRGETLDAGGPEIVTIEELLVLLRKAKGKGAATVLHWPLWPTRFLLRIVEPLVLPILPVTAGQLASFGEDGLADKNPPPPELFPSTERRIADILTEAAKND